MRPQSTRKDRYRAVNRDPHDHAREYDGLEDTEYTDFMIEEPPYVSDTKWRVVCTVCAILMVVGIAVGAALGLAKGHAHEHTGRVDHFPDEQDGSVAGSLSHASQSTNSSSTVDSTTPSAAVTTDVPSTTSEEVASQTTAAGDDLICVENGNIDNTIESPMFKKKYDDGQPWMHMLFRNKEHIVRDVENIDNGVRTHTRSDDPQVAWFIAAHVHKMHNRVESNCGKIPHQFDPLFQAISKHRALISLEYAETENGVKVTETSDHPCIVELIQAHAEAVSHFIERGMKWAMQPHDVPDCLKDMYALADVSNTS
eukprot:Clim_evm55s236 gene=Clim_evmTU55s236